MIWKLYRIKNKLSAFESEILPLHKSTIYDKRFRAPQALRGLSNGEEVVRWQDIPLYR